MKIIPTSTPSEIVRELALGKTIVAASVNQKGGVGKTSLTLNLGFELARTGLRILLIDLDPQASFSKNLIGEDELPNRKGIEELFLSDKTQPSECIVSLKQENLFILPCHNELASVGAKILLDSSSFFALREIIEKIDASTKLSTGGFDFILIDTPPSLGILTLNSFIAAEHLVIPIAPAVYSLLAVNDLLQSIEKTKKNLNKTLDILGVVVMMIDRRAALYCQIEDQVRGFFGSKVFDSVISRTVKSEEAVTEGVGVGSLAPDSKIAGEYRALVNELLARLGRVPDAAASRPTTCKQVIG
jgi:chromosome partitioning protein